MPLVFVLLICCMSSAAAPGPSPPKEAYRVQSFLDRVQVVCGSAAAQRCVNAGWNFAARDPGRGLSLADVERLRQRLGVWYKWRQATLRNRERLSIGLGLLLADGMGLDRLHGAFDADGDGWLNQRELLTDVRLDNRPLGEVLLDPEAVDRAALARRLKLPINLLNGLFH